MSASSTASLLSTAPGSGCVDRSAYGTRTYSACVPSIKWPRIQPPPSRHCPYVPSRQKRQRPHAVMHETRTRSPGRIVRTSLPTSTTSPTASCPSTVPGRTSGTSPLRMCRSVPQMVTASTRTIASVASWIPGSATSSHADFPEPWNTSAFMTIPFWAWRTPVVGDDGVRLPCPRPPLPDEVVDSDGGGTPLDGPLASGLTCYVQPERDDRCPLGPIGPHRGTGRGRSDRPTALRTRTVPPSPRTRAERPSTGHR